MREIAVGCGIPDHEYFAFIKTEFCGYIQRGERIGFMRSFTVVAINIVEQIRYTEFFKAHFRNGAVVGGDDE